MNRVRSILMTAVLLASAAASVGSNPAQAQLAVFDASSFGELVLQAEQGLRQLAQLEQVVTLSQQQLTRLTTFYTSFSHLTNVSQLASFLLQQNAINPLPQVAQIESVLRGQGFTGSLAAQSQGLLAKIQFYRPVGSDFTATEMQTDANATAGQMAAAEALYNSSTTRIQGIQQLQGSLAQSGDPKQSLDLQARATMENGLAAAQTNQAQSMAVLQQAQGDAEKQRIDQDWRKGAEGLVSDAETWTGQ